MFMWKHAHNYANWTLNHKMDKLPNLIQVGLCIYVCYKLFINICNVFVQSKSVVDVLIEFHDFSSRLNSVVRVLVEHVMVLLYTFVQ